MKAKRQKLIKGQVISSLTPVVDYRGLTVRWEGTPSFLKLPINDTDALIEQVARAIHGGSWTFDAGDESSREHYYESAKAALRSIGVPLGGRK